MVNKDTYYRLKKRIRETQGLQNQDINRWVLYRLGNLLDKDTTFIPNEADCRLSPRSLLSVEPESSDPEVDIVIFEKPERKDISSEFATTGKYHRAPSRPPSFLLVFISIDYLISHWLQTFF
jgi:hypothetical protein